MAAKNEKPFKNPSLRTHPTHIGSYLFGTSYNKWGTRGWIKILESRSIKHFRFQCRIKTYQTHCETHCPRSFDRGDLHWSIIFLFFCDGWLHLETGFVLVLENLESRGICFQVLGSHGIWNYKNIRTSGSFCKFAKKLMLFFVFFPGVFVSKNHHGICLFWFLKVRKFEVPETV